MQSRAMMAKARFGMLCMAPMTDYVLVEHPVKGGEPTFSLQLVRREGTRSYTIPIGTIFTDSVE